MTTGTEKEAKGKFENIGGKIKEKVGEATGNRSMEMEGRGEQVKGDIREGIGKAQRKIENP